MSGKRENGNQEEGDGFDLLLFSFPFFLTFLTRYGRYVLFFCARGTDLEILICLAASMHTKSQVISNISSPAFTEGISRESGAS